MHVIIWKDDQDRVVAFTPPGGMTAEQAKDDATLVPQDRPSFIVDNADMPDAPLAAWRLGDGGAVTVDRATVDALTTPPAPSKSDLQAKLDALASEIAALGK